MNVLNLKHTVLGLAALSLVACGGDDHDDHDHDAGVTPVADAGPAPIADAGTNPIEVPETYNFDSRFEEGKSALSYSGQTARQVLLSDLKGEFSRIAAELNDNSFSPAAAVPKPRLNFFFRFDGETSGDLPQLNQPWCKPPIMRSRRRRILWAKSLVTTLRPIIKTGQRAGR